MKAAGASVLAGLTLLALVTSASALRADPGQPDIEARWRVPLAHAEAALAAGDATGAERAWQEAYRAAIRSGAPGSLLELGHAYLRVGEAARGRETAIGRTRRAYLIALFRARQRRDADGAAAAGQAFAALGDREVADRAFAIALALAARNRDDGAKERIAALRQQSLTPGTPSTPQAAADVIATTP